jgi:hypothetical protein
MADLGELPVVNAVGIPDIDEPLEQANAVLFARNHNITRMAVVELRSVLAALTKGPQESTQTQNPE